MAFGKMFKGVASGMKKKLSGKSSMVTHGQEVFKGQKVAGNKAKLGLLSLAGGKKPISAVEKRLRGKKF